MQANTSPVAAASSAVAIHAPGVAVAPAPAKAKREKKSLQYAVRSGVAGGLAGMAVRFGFARLATCKLVACVGCLPWHAVHTVRTTLTSGPYGCGSFRPRQNSVPRRTPALREVHAYVDSHSMRTADGALFTGLDCKSCVCGRFCIWRVSGDRTHRAHRRPARAVPRPSGDAPPSLPVCRYQTIATLSVCAWLLLIRCTPSHLHVRYQLHVVRAVQAGTRGEPGFACPSIDRSS
jgi:hypothetical protein